MRLSTIARLAIKDIFEDWKFIPITGGGSPVLDPMYTLAKLRPVNDEENVMPKYKTSRDSGTKKTERAIKKAHKRNQTLANDARAKMRFSPYR